MPVLSSGQTLTSTTISTSAGSYIVETGATTLAITVEGAGTLDLQGGATTGTVLLAGGIEELFGNESTATGTLVSGGGVEYVFGGTASGAVIDSGGAEVVEPNGSASGAVVSAGGVQVVHSGGTATATTVDSGGIEIVLSRGVASNTTVDSGGTLVLLPGGAAPGVTGTPVTTGVVLFVGPGSVTTYATTATGVVVASGSNEFVLAGGVSLSGTVSGGNLYVYGGGTASDTTVADGAAYVSSGGQAVSATVGAGAKLTVLSGGVASNTSVGPSGTLFVLDGGSAAATSVGEGGFDYVYAGGTETGASVFRSFEYLQGGTASGTVLQPAGHQVVSQGGSGIGTTVGNSAFESVGLAGLAADLTIAQGGFGIVSSGGTVSNATVAGVLQASAGGIVLGQITVERGGATSGLAISSGATETVSSGGSAVATTVQPGGRQVVSLGGSTTGTVIDSGGLEFVSSGGTATATVVNNGDTLEIASGGSAVSPTLLSGGILDLAFIPFVAGGSASVNGGDLLTVDVGGTVYTQQLAGSYAGLDFVLSPDTGGGTDVTVEQVCYVAGTLILTDRGELPVEALQPGDLVATFSGAVRPVRWVGRRRVAVGRHAAPDRVRPVRIRAGAFGPGLPRRDLLVSPGHAMFLDGRLIPAVHLVNGATIVRDATLLAVEYCHIELDTHDVLFAEGVPSESYIDCGNRAFFANAQGVAPLLHGAPDRAWEDGETPAGYCAPVCTGGAALQAVRARLHARARALGWRRRRDPGLHLLADGVRVMPLSVTGGAYRFVLARAATELWLVSHPGVPAWTDPARDDRRSLGVAVSCLTWRGRAGARIVVGPRDAALSEGWHATERDGRGWLYRWTCGRARLPAWGAGTLTVEITDALAGWQAAAPGAARAA